MRRARKSRPRCVRRDCFDTMASLPILFEVGSYRMSLPGYATISAEVRLPQNEEVRSTSTRWTIFLGRFQLFVHISVDELSELKRFIDSTTKSDATVQSIVVNGIRGVTHGDYGPSRTWIDWWFKEGDITICFCLQSVAFPATEPTEAELVEHKAIIGSITSLIGSRS